MTFPAVKVILGILIIYFISFMVEDSFVLKMTPSILTKKVEKSVVILKVPLTSVDILHICNL